ncbi:hypothetical protein EHU66_21825 [Escherichia coli]|nr:hypothetical protein [Escherichia coli]
MTAAQISVDLSHKRLLRRNLRLIANVQSSAPASLYGEMTNLRYKWRQSGGSGWHCPVIATPYH